MKRKLISHEGFDKLNEGSFCVVENELAQAEDVISKVVGVKGLKLNCFNESTVIYETPSKTFLHANYKMNDKKIVLENIEELIIDEQSAKQKSKAIVSKMVEEMLQKNDAKANDLFKEYLSLPMVRKNLLESKAPPFVKKDKKDGKKDDEDKKNGFFGKKDDDKKDKKFKFKKVAKKKIQEWSTLSENVLNYVDFHNFSPTMKDTKASHDEKGNVVALSIPNSHLRNEGKLLSFNWKVLDTEVKVLRSKAMNVTEDTNFSRAMSDLKKCNNLSDNKALETTLANVVQAWPHLIYLTQSELAAKISEALETAGETNYDDQTCEFMAEAILRTVVEAYSERASKIIRLSGTTIKDKSDDFYEDFQRVTKDFYKSIDESMKTEMQVFTDLYNALVEVYRTAQGESNEVVRSEANGFLHELKSVLEQESKPTLELAEQVASWLVNLVETNLEGNAWDVSNSPHMTIVGDHPQMAKNASKGYTPSSDFSGDWGDSAPVSDGKSYKGNLANVMRNDSWGNWSSEETYPGLTNPYAKGVDATWTMKGEKGVDKETDGLVFDAEGDKTWPGLTNPYCPKAETPQSYKAKTDNLVIDQ
jgi:hypothetical protein